MSDSAFEIHADEPGSMLRAARTALGLDFEKAAAEMRTAASVVQAMEENRFEIFDAPVYAKGYLRRYATLLNLEPGAVIAAYDARSGGPSEPTYLPNTPAAPRVRAAWLYHLQMPSRRSVVTTAGIAVLLFGGYWYSGYRSARPVAALPAPAVVQPVAESPPANLPAEAARTDAPASRTAVETIPVTTESTQDPPVGVSNATVDPAADNITVIGVGNAFVEVRGPDGTRLFRDQVRAGELRTIRGQGPWGIYLSDINAVELRIGAHVVDVPAAKRTGAEARFALKPNGVIL